MYLVCMECSSGKKFVSVEGYFLKPLTVSGFTVMRWNFLSPMGLRCADCCYDLIYLLLVRLGKG